jgi:methylase of polypeptide subunit release factors
MDDVFGGGGALIKNFLVDELSERLGKQEKVLELCSGPGFIGLHMLETGFCEEIHLSDVNVYALPKNTKAKTIHSDGLKNISEKYDLIVCNPPWFDHKTYFFDIEIPSDRSSLIFTDEKWRLHKHIFSTASEHLNDGGYLVLLDCKFSTHPENFGNFWKNLELIESFNYSNITPASIMSHLSYTAIYRKTNG